MKFKILKYIDLGTENLNYTYSTYSISYKIDEIFLFCASLIIILNIDIHIYSLYSIHICVYSIHIGT